MLRQEKLPTADGIGTDLSPERCDTANTAQGQLVRDAHRNPVNGRDSNCSNGMPPLINLACSIAVWLAHRTKPKIYVFSAIRGLPQDPPARLKCSHGT